MPTPTAAAPDVSADRRPRRDCAHRGRPHRHGSRVAYVKDRCRCPACTDANTTANRVRRRTIILGRPATLTDAAPARAHITDLRASGLGYQTIARLAGTGTRHLRDLSSTGPTPTGRPPIRRIRANLADAILAIPADTHPILLDPTGTHRRLAALVALGWDLPQIAARLHRRPDSLARTLTARRITAATSRAVNRLYRELAGSPPPDTPTAVAARTYARQRGWAPPLAWDDIDTDPTPNPTALNAAADPDYLDQIAIERALTGRLTWRHLTPAETAETIRRLTRSGHSTRTIADHLHASPHTIRRHSPAGAAR